ncbi:MAG TPA: Rrf2 family transcriptional regulator, partial [Polaromonas sp.]|nr:Rrf2 family transcriptional regulator [Polaromonas sp.]
LAGWLETVRGKGGGMRLAVAPADIILGAVVRSIESDFFIVDCLASDTGCLLTGNCQLTSIISGALQSFMQYLDRYTLADLLAPNHENAAQLGLVAQPLTFRKRPGIMAS